MNTKIETKICPKHQISMRFELCQECGGEYTWGETCRTCHGKRGFWVCRQCAQEYETSKQEGQNGEQ